MADVQRLFPGGLGSRPASLDLSGAAGTHPGEPVRQGDGLRGPRHGGGVSPMHPDFSPARNGGVQDGDGAPARGGVIHRGAGLSPILEANGEPRGGACRDHGAVRLSTGNPDGSFHPDDVPVVYGLQAGGGGGPGRKGGGAHPHGGGGEFPGGVFGAAGMVGHCHGADVRPLPSLWPLGQDTGGGGLLAGDRGQLAAAHPSLALAVPGGEVFVEGGAERGKGERLKIWG